jgi:guanylate kinase
LDRIPALHRRIKELARTPGMPGKILSFTQVHNPPKGFGTEPYIVALLEQANGTKMMAQLATSPFPPAIGATVVPRLRRIRTMENGLFVNDLKYEVVERTDVPLFTMHAYVLALTGPAGVGKTTVTRALISLFSSFVEQVPMVVTKKRRKKTTEPVVVVTEEAFDALVSSGEIIAETELVDHQRSRGGYRRSDIDAIWKKAKLPIVTTDMRLLQGLAKSLGRRTILSCGLLPPGTSHRRMLSALLHRLRTREDPEHRIREQLKHAEAHLEALSAQADLFDHMLVNDSVDACVETIRNIVVPDQAK